MSRITFSLLAVLAGSVALANSALALAPHGTNWPFMPTSKKVAHLPDKATSSCVLSVAPGKTRGASRPLIYRPHP